MEIGGEGSSSSDGVNKGKVLEYLGVFGEGDESGI